MSCPLCDLLQGSSAESDVIHGLVIPFLAQVKLFIEQKRGKNFSTEEVGELPKVEQEVLVTPALDETSNIVGSSQESCMIVSEEVIGSCLDDDDVQLDMSRDPIEALVKDVRRIRKDMIGLLCKDIGNGQYIRAILKHRRTRERSMKTAVNARTRFEIGDQLILTKFVEKPKCNPPLLQILEYDKKGRGKRLSSVVEKKKKVSLFSSRVESCELPVVENQCKKSVCECCKAWREGLTQHMPAWLGVEGSMSRHKSRGVVAAATPEGYWDLNMFETQKG